MDCLSRLRKDNTGYDIKQLFIGAEGTLGIVTKVALLCIPKPASVNVAFVGKMKQNPPTKFLIMYAVINERHISACQSFEALLQTFSMAKRMLNEILSAFELIDQESLKVLQLHFKIQSPIEPVSKYPFYVLLETMGSNDKHDGEKLMLFIEHAMRDGLISDGCAYAEPSRIKVRVLFDISTFPLEWRFLLFQSEQ